MSDLVLGTILGGSIGVIGSLLSFIIQGHYSKSSTELQIRARREEQKQQFENERQTVEISRKIERRAQNLNPISNALESIMKSVHDIEKVLRDLVVNSGEENFLYLAVSSETGYLNS